MQNNPLIEGTPNLDLSLTPQDKKLIMLMTKDLTSTKMCAW